MMWRLAGLTYFVLEILIVCALVVVERRVLADNGTGVGERRQAEKSIL